MFITHNFESSGGSWFEGMDQVLSKQHPVVDFNRMRGRKESDDDADKDVLEQELGGVEQGLDLEVKDYHPNKAKVPVVTIQDPKKYPRFVEPKKEEKPADAPPTPTPKYDLIRENPNKFAVDMGKMQSRNLIRQENELLDVDEAVYGAIDREAALKLASENAQNYARGQDVTSKLARVPLLVDMNKQQSRKNAQAENRLVNDEIDDLAQIYVDDAADETTGGNLQKKGNLVDFGKMRGRSQYEEDKIHTLDYDLIPHEELILEPNDAISSRCWSCSVFIIHSSKFYVCTTISSKNVGLRN